MPPWSLKHRCGLDREVHGTPCAAAHRCHLFDLGADRSGPGRQHRKGGAGNRAGTGLGGTRETSRSAPANPSVGEAAAPRPETRRASMWEGGSDSHRESLPTLRSRSRSDR